MTTRPHSVSIPEDIWQLLQERIARTPGMSASQFITMAIIGKLELDEGLEEIQNVARVMIAARQRGLLGEENEWLQIIKKLSSKDANLLSVPKKTAGD